jgi:cytoskeleton protein RodZ
MTPELTQAQGHLSDSNGETSERHSPGALIRQARERARMTPEELAAQTKLARSTLDALERDDFNILIEPVYVRGYYRKCSKVLDISEKDLLDAYEARVAPRAPALPAKLRLASGTELGTGGRLPIPLAALGAVAAIVISGLIWLARGEINNSVPPAVSAKADAMVPQSVSIQDSAISTLAADVQTASSPIAEAPASTESEPAAPAASVQAPVAVPTPNLTSAPAPTTMPGHPLPLVAAQTLSSKPVPATAVPSTPGVSNEVPVGGSGTLTLDFSITSWARVDDASGKTLLNGLMRAGDKQTLNGATPFKVFLGNAPGVKAAVNGKSVDLIKYTAANNTARFAIGGGKP